MALEGAGPGSGPPASADGRPVLEALTRPNLPPTYERWRVALPPRSSRRTGPAEWAGALVLVEHGTLEVECRVGGRRTFEAGTLLALGWLPLERLHNWNDGPVSLLAVRRRGARPTREFLHLIDPGTKGEPMRYRTQIQSTGATTTGIPVPEEIVDALGGGKRPAVVVRLRGHAYRGSVATVDGAPMISLSSANREKAGVGAGDEVDVELELDTEPRTVSVPDDFAAALAADPEAKATFDRISYSNQRWHVESITGAKTDETRRRRIAKSVAILHDGRPR